MAKESELVKMLADLIKNGINMDSYNLFECNMFMKELFEFINSNTHLNAHYSKKKVLIESVFFEPLLSVELDKKTIQCIPVTDEGWIDSVYEVLKFVHLRNKIMTEKKKKEKIQKEEDNKQFDWI